MGARLFLHLDEEAQFGRSTVNKSSNHSFVSIWETFQPGGPYFTNGLMRPRNRVPRKLLGSFESSQQCKRRCPQAVGYLFLSARYADSLAKQGDAVLSLEFVQLQSCVPKRWSMVGTGYFYVSQIWGPEEV